MIRITTFLLVRRKHEVALVAILAISAILRFAYLDRYPIYFHHDELFMMEWVLHILAGTGPGPLDLAAFKGPMLGLLPSAAAIWIFGPTEFALRGTSAVFGTASVFLFYIVARQYGVSKPASLLSTLLFSTSLIFLHVSRMGWYDVHNVLFALGAFYCLTAASRRAKFSRTTILLYSVAGLLAAFAAYSHGPGRLVIVALMGAGALFFAQSGGSRRLALLGLGVVVCVYSIAVIPLIYTLFIAPSEIGVSRFDEVYILSPWNRVYFHDASVWQILFLQLDATLRGYFLFDPNIHWVEVNSLRIAPGHGILSMATGIFVWVGLIIAFRKPRFWACGVMLALLIFPVQILLIGAPEAGRSVTAIPFYFIFVGLALDTALLGVRRILGIKWIRGAAVGVLVVVIFAISAREVAEYFYWHTHPAYSKVFTAYRTDTITFDVWVRAQEFQSQYSYRDHRVIAEWLIPVIDTPFRWGYNPISLHHLQRTW